MLLSYSNNNHTYNDDIRNIISDIDADILYLDPPYNERDYSSYYHVLETISKYDNPDLKNNITATKKNIKKSNWCIKSKVVDELEYIIEKYTYFILFTSIGSLVLSWFNIYI